MANGMTAPTEITVETLAARARHDMDAKEAALAKARAHVAQLEREYWTATGIADVMTALTREGYTLQASNGNGAHEEASNGDASGA